MYPHISQIYSISAASLAQSKTIYDQNHTMNETGKKYAEKCLERY
ncbi:hypothetical protein DHBDCA_p2724 [Dehalobacter sp. DCA]|nr:hypothetical protein DHBDCA_p2724 [Dehalobacter sp. DCA]AFV06737.1 hypothetical protein DCF50_p2734 [Dehalobacter sp. CF]